MCLHVFADEIDVRLAAIQHILEEDNQWNGQAAFRPFVCNGNPYNCRVMFVGLNSANRMPQGWRTYWSDIHGFMYDNWRHDYDEYRGNGRPSNTRKNIERIMFCAGASDHITTNLYSIPTSKASELPHRFQIDQMRGVFEYLIDELSDNVHVIVPFGKDAVEWFRNNFLDQNRILWPFTRNERHLSWHFGYGFSQERLTRLGQELRDRLGG